MKWSRTIPARFALSLSFRLTPTLKTCEITFYRQSKIDQVQFVFICYFFTDALEWKCMQTIILYDMIYLGFWIPSIRWVPGLGSRVSLLGSWVLDSTFAVPRPVPRLPPLRWVPGCQALLKIRELHLIFQWRNFFRRFLGDLPKKKKKKKMRELCV